MFKKEWEEVQTYQIPPLLPALLIYIHIIASTFIEKDIDDGPNSNKTQKVRKGPNNGKHK